MAHDLTRATTPHVPFSSVLSFSHGHFGFTVGDKVGLRGQVVLAVAVASAAVEGVWIQNGALRPLVAVVLPPAHRLSPIPALQPQPHCMPSCNGVRTVSQRAAHSSGAGAKCGPSSPGDAQRCAAWHCPSHVRQGGSPKSWRLATVAVNVSVRAVQAVGAVGNVAVGAFGFVAIRFESTSSSSPTGKVAFCWEC